MYYIVYCIFLSLFLDTAESLIIQTKSIPAINSYLHLNSNCLLLEKKIPKIVSFILDVRMQTGLTYMQNTASQL